jgi:Flp pilus assembly protein TadG
MRTTKDKHSHNRNIRAGVAAVEFAIIAPILLIFVIAIIEITGAIYLQQSLTIASYEGARVALLPKSNSSNVTAASNRILESRRIKGATVNIIPNDFKSARFGDPIKVEVSAPLNKNGVFYRFFSKNQSFTYSVTMMKEY